MPTIDINKKRNNPNARIEIETFWSEITDWENPKNVCGPVRGTWRTMNTSRDILIPLGRSEDGRYSTYDISIGLSVLSGGSMLSGIGMFRRITLLSLIKYYSPEEVSLVLLDPIHSLADFDGVPHLVFPRAITKKMSEDQIDWCIEEMDRRYDLLEKEGCSGVHIYNASQTDPTKRLPTIIIMISELGDYTEEKFTTKFLRLLQLSRLAEIRLIFTTQRPSIETVNPLVSQNVFTRIAFQMPGAIESKIFLDKAGAENLHGQGDMIYKCECSDETPEAPIRIQGFHHPVPETKATAQKLCEKYTK